jgi:hypothetical protein
VARGNIGRIIHFSGEVGCFLGHRNAWRQIVERKPDAATFLEDDDCIGQIEFGDVVEFAAKSCPMGTPIQLSSRALSSNAPEFACSEGRRMVCSQFTGRCRHPDHCLATDV